jgi:TP901 family phage tail tape measure protein
MAVLQSTLKLTLLDQVSGRVGMIAKSLGTLQRQQHAFMGAFSGLLAMTAGYVGVTQGIQGTVGAAMSFESAFADVRKVVEATDDQFQNMELSIRKMSTQLPTTANDLAALYAAAGESGVATEDLNTFALMAARVGIAFDMTAGEAGDSLAKLKTQLGLTVLETGDMADAINHLSNNMASKAKDVTEYMLRVGALAEMGGFAKEEIAAIGSAMIAAGATPETAGTAMQNVVKAMTRGKFAKKEQRDAAKAMGLDLPTLAKQMQKDAPGALKTVLKAIAKAPKDQQISLLSQFFGDEAKAFAPLVGKMELLDNALDSVADKTKYAGSAYKEYIERAKTTANVLQILQNKFAELGRSIGDGMLPNVKEAALGIGDILDTLGERATVFDDMKVAMQGFAQGLGYDGGIREMINDIGDLLLGPADGSKSADELGRIFAMFKGWGEDIKWFGDQVDAAITKVEEAFKMKPGTIKETLGEIAGWGFTFGAGSIGISMMAGAVMALGRAMAVLSGASLLLGGVKGINSLFATLGGVGKTGAVSAAAGAIGKTPAAAAAAATTMSTFGKWMTGLTVAMGLWDANKNASQEGMQDNVNGARAFADGVARLLFGDEVADQSFAKDPVKVPGADRQPGEGWAKLAAWIEYLNGPKDMGDAATRRRQFFEQETGPRWGMDQQSNPLSAIVAQGIRIDASSIAEMATPRGVQQVQVMNQQPPNVTVNAPITINGVMDPRAAASQAASQLGSEVKSAVESHHGEP